MPAAQKKKLFHARLTIPLVALGMIVMAFLIYYFPFTEHREAALNDRAFRSLAAVSDNLQDRIGAYSIVLYQASKKGEPADIRKYINDTVPDLKYVEPEKEDKLQTAGCKENATKVISKPNTDGSYLLRFTCGSVSADVLLERLLAAYVTALPDKIFDEILLADDQGAVLYQTRKTGNRINHLPPLRPATEAPVPVDPKGSQPSAPPPPAFSTSSQLSSLLATDIGGTPYKVYAVPVPAAIVDASEKNERNIRLVVGGLLRQSRFRAESMKISGPVPVAFMLLVLTVMFSTWPLLKFRSMRMTERIPRRSAVYFFLSMLATLMLVFILLIHLGYSVDMSLIDRNLMSLATAIDRNSTGEIHQALRIMEAANRSATFQENLKEQNEPDGCLKTIVPSDYKPPTPETRILARLTNPQFGDYPYFERIFWIDEGGYQRVKWEVGSETTPPTVLKERIYFRETTANHLWSFSDPSNGDHLFRVDPFVSKNTGEFRAAISQPIKKVSDCKKAQSSLAVLTMVTPLLSLIDPVMPPDYGFAVVDDEGRVKFHSDSTKADRENFLNELADPGELRDALFAGQGSSFGAQYQGLEHRLFVTRFTGIKNSPWSLIVFYDLTEYSALHLDQILLSLFLTLMFFSVVGFLLILLPQSKRVPLWVWPREKKRGDYLQLTLALLLIAPAFYFLIFRIVRPGAILVTAFAIPVICLGMAISKLKSRDRPIVILAVATPFVGVLTAWIDGEINLHILFFIWIAVVVAMTTSSRIAESLSKVLSKQNSFTAMCATSIMLAGALPCVAFFKVAYDFQEDVSTRRYQVQTIAALRAREERLKTRYAKLNLLDGTEPGFDAGNWLFIRRRLEQSTDRYDIEFLNRASGQLYYRATGPSADSDCEDRLPSSLVKLTSLIPSSTSTLTRKLGAPEILSSAWTWSREGSNRIRLRERKGSEGCTGEDATSPVTHALIKSVTGDPIFLSPNLVSELPILRPAFWYWIGFALALSITIALIRPTLKKMFVISWEPIDSLPQFGVAAATPINEDIILLGFDEIRQAEGVLSQRQDVFVLDLADLTSSGAVNAIPAPIVLIKNIDHRLGEPEIDRKKLEILEHIRSTWDSKKLVIVSSVDPVYYFRARSGFASSQSPESGVNESDLYRWSRLLVDFKPMLLPETSSATRAERARLIWFSCSIPERVVLYQLAHDGWVNHKNSAAIAELQRRGIIRGIPFHFKNGALRQFALDISSREARTWEKEQVASTWEGIRLSLFVLLLGLFSVFVFSNQQTAVFYIATGTGILATLSRLFTEAHGLGSFFSRKVDGSK